MAFRLSFSRRRARVEDEIARIDAQTNRRIAMRERVHAAVRDLALALRAIVRRPTYAVTVIATLGLGMGAATTMYALLQRTVIDPLPYPGADRMVRFMNHVPAVGKTTMWEGGYAQYFFYAKAPAVEAIGVYDRDAVNITNGGDPWRARIATVSASVFDLIGARAVRGRMIGAQDDVPRAPQVAMLSHEAWTTRFGGDDAVVGTVIRVNDEPVEVVGVLAPGVALPPERGADFGLGTDVWVAYRLNPAGPFYNNHTHPLIGRLRPGASLAQAQAQVDQLLDALPDNFPQAYRKGGVGRAKFWTEVIPLKDWALGDAARNIWIAFAAVILVLLIACANVGNLFLVRLETQRQEFAVRSALGAGTGDIALAAFAEAILLAAAGGAVAVLVGIAGMRALTALAPSGIPRLEELTFGWEATAFLAVVAVGVAGTFAAVAAAHVRRTHIILGDGGRSATAGVDRQRARATLVALQVALALTLVVSAGLLLESFAKLRAVDAGVDTRGVMTVEWFLPYARYDSAWKVWQFDKEALARIRALPNVASAGASNIAPLYDGFGCTVQGFEDQAVYGRLEAAHQSTCAGQGNATPGFLATIGVPMVAGRDFVEDDFDDPSRGAVIVTKAFADRFWPGENAIGKGVNPNGYGKPPFYHVVGVARDFKGMSLEGQPAIGVFYPTRELFGRFWNAGYTRLFVRAKNGDPMALVRDVQRVVHELDPSIPVANAEPMEAARSRAMSHISFTTLLLGVAGIVALFLATVGLYGAISYLVVRRTNEIGVRIALGAPLGQVQRLVVANAMRMATAGVVLGLVGSVAVAQALRGLLFGVAPWNPLPFAGAVVVLLATSAVAAWVPARRAARVDPVAALRGG